MIEVVSAGARTSIERPFGTPGHAHEGVSRGGAFDSLAALTANRAVSSEAARPVGAPATLATEPGRASLARAPSRAAGVAGRLIIEEIRKRSDLDGTTLILVDPSAEADPDLRATARWNEIPDDLARLRGAIDRVLEKSPISAAGRPAYDARSLGESIAAFGHSLEDRGLVEEAAAALRYAGELAPTVIGHPLRLARLLLAQHDVGHYPEATALVDRVLTLEPRSVDALILRALLCDERRERDAARVALQRALQLDQGRPETSALLARLDKGQALVQRTTFGEAKTPTGALGRLKKMFGG